MCLAGWVVVEADAMTAPRDLCSRQQFVMLVKLYTERGHTSTKRQQRLIACNDVMPICWRASTSVWVMKKKLTSALICEPQRLCDKRHESPRVLESAIIYRLGLSSASEYDYANCVCDYWNVRTISAS